MPSAANRLLHRQKVCSLIPSLWMVSPTEVPDSACRGANAIYSYDKWLLPIRNTTRSGDAAPPIPDGSRNGENVTSG